METWGFERSTEGEPLALSVRNLYKKYQGRRGRETIAVRDVSFDVQSGASLGIVGESGSGKSTIARIIAGLERPSGGTVALAGLPTGTARTAGRPARLSSRGLVQMVFQDPHGSLNPRQRIGSGLLELLTIHRVRRRGERTARALDLLGKVGLAPSTMTAYPRELSGGQRQRVAIARALALEPAILILDEAVSALDVLVQAQIIRLLEEIRGGIDITYLVISHDLAVIRQLTDHSLILLRGEVIERGPTAALLEQPEAEYTRALIAAVPRPGWVPRRRTALVHGQRNRLHE